jgi:DNA-directed RNA polymerase specialized sigma24 family protein
VPLGTIKSRLHAALAAFAKAYKTQDGSESRL